jgi:predicted GNAT superfamily acetyltransferase
VTDDDLEAFLSLNRESEALLSPMDADSMRALLVQAYVALLSADRQAMVVALDERAHYRSPNFLWFSERYPRFTYIDRIAVAHCARKRGHARALYEAVIARARADGHTVLCAEIYAEPRNAVSDAFHEAMGFEEIGRAYLSDRAKTVRYVVRPIQ